MKPDVKAGRDYLYFVTFSFQHNNQINSQIPNFPFFDKLPITESTLHLSGLSFSENGMQKGFNRNEYKEAFNETSQLDKEDIPDEVSPMSN